MQKENRPITLLLVEDDNADAKAVFRALAREPIPHRIVRTVDGQDALQLLGSREPESRLASPFVVLLDLNMPRMNGLAFLEELRRSPTLRETIVFVLTTSKRPEDIDAAYQLNVSGYVLKERAGAGLDDLVALLRSYWRTVELPDQSRYEDLPCAC